MTIIDAWFYSAVGTKMNPDGHYGLQCVDVIDHYAEFIFGVPWQECVGGVAGAKDLLDRAPDAYWIRIDYYHGFVPQYGDVLVFAGDQYNQWGHTAVTRAATISSIAAVQQDGFARPSKFVDGAYYSDKPCHNYQLYYAQNGTGRLSGVLRPRVNMLKSSINVQSVPVEDEMNAEQEKKLNAIHDRIFGRDIQRWMNPENGAVSETPVAGWVAMRSADLHDILSLNNLINNNTQRVLDAVSKVPGIDEAVIAELKEELTSNISVTLTSQ